MIKKSTQLNLVNDLVKGSEELKDWSVKMEDSELSISGAMESRSPSNETINAILAFAKSYSFLPSRTLEGIDLYLN